MTQMSQPRKYILTVSHNIFLTKDQRYRLADRRTIKVVGVSVPVWVCKDDSLGKGYTSEPAVEVFCKYVLTNKPDRNPIHKIEEGYQVNMPQLPSDYKEPRKLSNEKWREMSGQEKEKWYKENERPATAENLRDLLDGGCGYLRFEEYNMENAEGKFVTIGHYVKIEDLIAIERSIEKDLS